MLVRYLILFVLVLLGAGASAAPDFPAYSVTDLKALGIWPVAMNQNGEVVGRACCGGQSLGAQLYKSGQVRDLGLPPGAFFSFDPLAINDDGWVVGNADSNQDPVLVVWSPAFHDGVSWTVIDTSPFSVGHSYASGINNVGQVIGGTGGSSFVAWLFDRGTLFRLSPASISFATDISETGEVVGYDNFYSINGAWWTYSDGQLTTFTSVGRAVAVNDAGNVLVTIAGGAGVGSQAYLFSGGVEKGFPKDGCWATFPDRHRYDYYAVALNERGDVLGYGDFACLYNSGTSVGLGTLGGDRSRPQSLNNRAQVAGWSLDSQGRYRPFVYDDGVMLDVADLRGVGATLQLGNPTELSVAINDAPYVLVIATGKAGEQSTLEAAYLLTPIAPTVTLKAVPSVAPVRTPVTLTWSSQNANSCVATGGVTGDGWAGARPTSGQITVTANAAGTAEYAMRCTAGPLSAEANVSVLYDPAPPAVRLTATPSASRVGKSVTLAWASEGADSCVAIGGRSGDGWTGILVTSGQQTVSEVQRGDVQYGIRCLSGALSSEIAVSVTFKAISGGGGYVDVLAVLGLAGLGLSRRRTAQAWRDLPAIWGWNEA
jgi:hypothetical protein